MSDSSLKRSVKAWQKRILDERRRTRGIDSETQSVSFGPLMLDVSMARAHGWTEAAIRRAHDVLRTLATKESAIARRRRPNDYLTVSSGLTVFVGDMSPEAMARLKRDLT